MVVPNSDHALLAYSDGIAQTTDKFDVLVNVRGGGFTGQAGAVRHGIARALLQADADYRPVLKKLPASVPPAHAPDPHKHEAS